ncbi:hypothetical protein [Chitinophaga sp. Cy-1792]|uniref:hypothetical protein n=1 Tax=Chitinophaga sp. Cy-1792 TaxID=2608339 RepID=UPI0014249763|nr:hypothetical protein [Chitinophaga sp. Cy-1792]NIG52254.1 hypothetical protein [Chitinophaga sp. Cy-1792]
MNIRHYIDEGNIERVLLNLATPDQVREYHFLRMISPTVDVEAANTELTFEHLFLEDAVMPPASVKHEIMQRIRDDDTNRRPPHNKNGYTNSGNGNGNDYLEIKQGWKRDITVSIWWRCAFIALCVLVMALAASTWYLNNQVNHLQDALIRLKVPSSSTTH